MRLSQEEVVKIKSCVFTFDPLAKVYLYGSRVDDAKRGGDIDLFIISKKMTRDDVRRLRLNLYDAIGEQKIDLLVKPDVSDSFTQLIFPGALLL